MRLSVLYIPHGGEPCSFMDWPPDPWRKVADWLRALGDSIGAIPKAVLVISGHWEEPHFTVKGHLREPLA